MAGRLLRGNNGFFGEIGHILSPDFSLQRLKSECTDAEQAGKIPEDKIPLSGCRCPFCQKTCLESLIRARVFESENLEVFKQKTDRERLRTFAQNEWNFRLLKQYIGFMVGTIINLFNPEVLILTGRLYDCVPEIWNSMNILKSSNSLSYSGSRCTIIPGSKNTTEDLLYLKREGYAKEICELAEQGTPVIGVCVGFQMLGEKVSDPDHVESQNDEVDGLGLLPYTTVMQGVKNTYQVHFDCDDLPFLDMQFKGSDLKGYEIHMGETTLNKPAQTLFHIISRSSKDVDVNDGYINEKHNVFGTYCHGVFDNDELRRAIINALRKRKGLSELPIQFRYREYKESEYDRLADSVRKYFDMDTVYEILRNE